MLYLIGTVLSLMGMRLGDAGRLTAEPVPVWGQTGWQGWAPFPPRGRDELLPSGWVQSASRVSPEGLSAAVREMITIQEQLVGFCFLIISSTQGTHDTTYLQTLSPFIFTATLLNTVFIAVLNTNLPRLGKLKPRA